MITEFSQPVHRSLPEMRLLNRNFNLFRVFGVVMVEHNLTRAVNRLATTQLATTGMTGALISKELPRDIQGIGSFVVFLTSSITA